MHPKDADGMANSVDPDQTASSEAVWSWSALFVETYLSQYIEFVRYLVVVRNGHFSSQRPAFVFLLKVFGLTALLDSISVYIETSFREREKKKLTDERKKCQKKKKKKKATRTDCKRSKPLSYYYLNQQDAPHWKLTQHHPQREEEKAKRW